MHKKRKRKVIEYIPNRFVRFLRNPSRYHPSTIPKIGKRYHCFDDGKISLSRHFIIKIDEILDFMQFKKKYPEMVKQYIEETKSCYWLYSRRSDKFIITLNGEGSEPGVYIRTKDGGWFGIGYFSSRLDVTGKLWKRLIQDLDLFNYTEEEKRQIVEENTI